MYYNYKTWYDLFRFVLFVFIFISSILLVFNFAFPNEAFAMDPNIVTDFYGNQEYVGKDPYGHFNQSNKPITSISDTIQPSQPDSYGTTPRLENDWYASNDPQYGQSIQNKDSSFYIVYTTLKRRAYWYVWKIHSDDYRNYKDFKISWDPKNSIRKEVIKDVKFMFNRSTRK